MNNKCCDGRFHTIKKGDTLYSLARMYNVPLVLLLKANPYIDVYNMQIGEKVCIPLNCEIRSNELDDEYENESDVFAYVVMPGESLEDILKKFDVTIMDIIENNKAEDIIMKPGITILLPK